MMKIGLIAVMIVLALITVDITVRIGWDRFISGIGSLVDGYWHAKQVSPETAQPRTTPPRLESPPPEARPTSPAQMDPRGSFGDGIKVVGKDIKPGTYRTRVRAPGCYWVRLSGGGGTLASGLESGPAIVTIGVSDKAFNSKGCGLWTPDLSAITKSLSAPFSDGTYIIGTDIAPGTWRASAPESCYWARLQGFSGGGKDTISNANYNGIVTIEATDGGFRSKRCGTWTLAAPLGLSKTRDVEQVSPNTVQSRATPPPLEAQPGDSASPRGTRGYKDFAWGDSVQAVKRRVPDLESSPAPLLYKAIVGAYLVQYGSLYDVSIPNPLSRVVGKLGMFDSRASRTQFGFVDGKLFAVAVFFTTENPLPSLEQKYGTTPAHTMGGGDYRYTVHAWFADPHRVIIYLRWLGEETDVVTYVDSMIYNKAAARLVQERKSESKDSLKRID